MKITGIELRIKKSIENNLGMYFLAAVMLLSLALRYATRNIWTSDMWGALVPWYREIGAKGGLRALKEQVGDYNLIYQTLIALMTYIHIDPIYQIKFVSGIFDYILAFSMAELVYENTNIKRLSVKYNVIIAGIVFLPTVFINSAIWGQCDAIYTVFVVNSIRCLLKREYRRAYGLLGLGFAFKLQTIFVIPFYIIYYIKKSDHSIFSYLYTIVVFWLSGIVAYIMGRPLYSPFQIYLFQTNEYAESMWRNAMSFWRLLVSENYTLKVYAVGLTVFILGIMMYIYLSGYRDVSSFEEQLVGIIWSIWTCILFLPFMHERYGYIMEILMVVLSMVRYKYIPYAIVAELGSLMMYGNYLFNRKGGDEFYINLIYFVVYLLFTFREMIGSRCNQEGI